MSMKKSDKSEKTAKLPLVQTLISARNIKFTAIALLIIISVALSVLQGLVTARFTLERIGTAEYWFNVFSALFRNSLFMVALLWAAMIVTDKTLSYYYDKINEFWRWMINNRLSQHFARYLESVNKQAKIFRYREIMQEQLYKPKTPENEKEKIRKILEFDDEELWNGAGDRDSKDKRDNEPVKYMKINYPEASEVYIFSGSVKKLSSELGYEYKPIQSAVQKTVPAMIITTLFMAVIFSFIPVFLEPTPETWFQLCVNIAFLILNGISGYTIGEYIVAVEKRAFVLRRAKLAFGFYGDENCPKDIKFDAPTEPE